MTALQAFSREEATRWQHACKTLRRKKCSLGLVKKTQESCFTAGRQMLLTRLRWQEELGCFRRRLRLLREDFAGWLPRSMESARHMAWQGYFQSRSSDSSRPPVCCLWMDPVCSQVVHLPASGSYVDMFSRRLVSSRLLNMFFSSIPI